jgi:hypothetical protein
MDTQTAQIAQRVRPTRALWILGSSMWAIAILGWPLLALAQLVFTPDAGGSSIGSPPTLADVGYLLFIISVPAAVAFMGLALISSYVTAPALTPLTPAASLLRTSSLVALVLVVSFVAFMAAQLVGFFFLSDVISTVFQLR